MVLTALISTCWNMQRLLDIALWNSYIIHTKIRTKHHLDFCLSIVNEIMNKYHQEATSTVDRSNSIPNPLWLSEHHFPYYFPSTEEKVNQTKQCVAAFTCGEENYSRDLRFYYPTSNIALCVSPCFSLLHSSQYIRR